MSKVRTSTTFNELYLKGRLINEDDDRVQSVTAMMDWLDESGRTIELNEVAFRKKYHAPLHRGDRSVFGARYEVPVEIESVRIRDVVVHRVPTESRVGPGESACLRWQTNAPEGVSIAARIRRVQRQVPFFKVEVEFENTGVALQTLKLGLVAYDDDQTPLTRTGLMNTISVNHGLAPLLQAGEKRVHSRSVSFAQGFGAQDVHRVCFDVLDVGLPSSLP